MLEFTFKMQCVLLLFILEGSLLMVFPDYSFFVSRNFSLLSFGEEAEEEEEMVTQVSQVLYLYLWIIIQMDLKSGQGNI